MSFRARLRLPAEDETRGNNLKPRKVLDVKKTLLLLMISAVCLACGQKSDAASKPVAANANPAQPAQKWKLPPDHPPMGQARGAMTASAPMQNAPAAQPLTGKVLETMNAGGYTYIKLKTDAGEPWVAVQQTQVKVGSTVTVNAQMTLDNFKSQTLNRTFDHIVFATMGGEGAAAAPAAAGPHGALAAAPKNVGDVNVPKAQGGDAKTVAEVWAAKDTLKDAPVTIRGKVVKFLPGIMGKNWLHLRDGSGSAEKSDNDITVVTKDVAAIGDVVIVKGTIRVDKDFGAGYKYPVIVEDAKVTK
jgi:hypothetical protein